MYEDAFFADSRLGCGRKKSFLGRSLRWDWLGRVLGVRQHCLDLGNIPLVTNDLDLLNQIQVCNLIDSSILTGTEAL